MSGAGQQEETVEFYKIQLMEKDREIADFTARMKKVEFKHGRELKEAKIARERADALLRDEKGRSDKHARAANEHAQQNAVLELRLAELKRDREREVADLAGKYNALKEEVRSYERILPTFTFLTDLGLALAQLPNYEDLYFASRQKAEECQLLQHTLAQAQAEAEDTQRTLRANEELLKAKRAEAEKNLKEVLNKLIEHEHLISDLRLQNQELAESCAQLEEELSLGHERCESLEESIRDYESKMERLAEEFEGELAAREEEAQRERRSEVAQLQEELLAQQAHLDRKEALFSEQLRLQEEENAFLTTKYQAEIDTFEDHFLALKDHTERVRNEITHEKRRYDQLQDRYTDTNSALARVSALLEQAEERSKALELRMATAEQRAARESRANEQQERERAEQLQGEFEQLAERLEAVSEHCGRLEEERDHLQEENYLLREELSATQIRHSESKSFFLELPRNVDERLRKKSTEIDSPNPLVDAVRERRNSQEETRVRQLEREVAQLQERCEAETHKAAEAESKLSQLQVEAETQRTEREKLQQDIMALKDKNMTLTRANNEHEKTAYGNSTKNKLDRSRVEALEEELRQLTEDSKREKEASRKAREETKAARQAHAADSERLAKQVKQLITQLEAQRTEKEKTRTDLTAREKALAHETALLKSSRELEQILKDQIRQLREDKEAQESAYLALQDALLKANDQVILHRKEAERLEAALQHSHREAQAANEALERERKERSLLTVPSLQSIGEEAQEETFNQIYATIPQKEGEIHLLQRQLQDLREEMETLRLTQQARVEMMEGENAHYVQTIIQMKMRCAESEMRASEKEYLHSQLKKRAVALGLPL